MKKGFALLTVLAYVLMLNFLVALLYMSVSTMISTLRVIQDLPAKQEAFASGTDVALVLISNTLDTQTSTSIDLAQGHVVVTASLMRSLKSDKLLQAGTCAVTTDPRQCNAVNYWNVNVTFKDTYTLTGTAVQYVMFQPDKDYVYLLDFKEGRK